MIKNKRGWIRILEATIAILIIGSVLLVMYSRNIEKDDVSEYAFEIEKEVLADISLKPELRRAVLEENITVLRDFASEKIPLAFEFEILVCDLGIPCNMDHYVEKDVFVEESIISADLQGYGPKKVRLFLWESE